jgi:hypothetical protein
LSSAAIAIALGQQSEPTPSAPPLHLAPRYQKGTAPSVYPQSSTLQSATDASAELRQQAKPVTRESENFGEEEFDDCKWNDVPQPENWSHTLDGVKVRIAKDTGMGDNHVGVVTENGMCWSVEESRLIPLPVTPVKAPLPVTPAKEGGESSESDESFMKRVMKANAATKKKPYQKRNGTAHWGTVPEAMRISQKTFNDFCLKYLERRTDLEQLRYRFFFGTIFSWLPRLLS